jgi:hypothetical protein
LLGTSRCKVADDVRRDDAATAVSCSVPASQRGRDGFGLFDTFDQHVDAVAAPEQFAVEHHGGHAEHAEGLRLINDAVMLSARRTVDVGFEIRR